MAGLNPRVERRLFGLIVCILAIVPILAGAAGILRGPAMIAGVHSSAADLDSHFRYLSGLLFAIGLGFVFSVFDIDGRAALFRALGLIVIAGGVSRLLGALSSGLPGTPHRFALVMELIVVPGLMLWLARIRRRAARQRDAQ